MSVTQPPPSNVPVRRSRIRPKTSSTTFLRRRRQRGASAVLPSEFLGFARRFRRFSSSAPFCFPSLVAARRLFDIINANLSVLLIFAESTRFLRRRFVSILPRFDVFSFQKSVKTLIPLLASVVGAPFGPGRRCVRKRFAAPSSFWEATRRPTYGDTLK